MKHSVHRTKDGRTLIHVDLGARWHWAWWPERRYGKWVWGPYKSHHFLVEEATDLST